MIRNLSFIIFVLFIPSFIFGQTKTNLDIYNELVDSSVISLINNLPQGENEINLKLELGDSYSFFQNRILYDLNEKKIKINMFPTLKDGVSGVNYVIEEMDVNYSDIDRDGMFGDFMMPRELNIEGNYSISNKKIFTKNFNYTFLDTVNVKAVNEIENESYPFTKGDIPSEPFFSSISEPVIALSSAAVAIILFYTIRSK